MGGVMVEATNGKLRFIDPRVSVGNLLTIIGISGATIAVYAGREADIATIKMEIAHLERAQDEQDKINSQQDARWQLVLSDMKIDIREMRGQIEVLLQRGKP